MEIMPLCKMTREKARRSLHRERGWKYLSRTHLILHQHVAPFTGSVDGNVTREEFESRIARRSLHRERGWKYHIEALSQGRSASLPSQGAWMEI